MLRVSNQQQPLQQHMARQGSACARERFNIASFDVIPAGSSSDVCPEQRLRMSHSPPPIEQACCAMLKGFTEELGITMAQHRQDQVFSV